MRGIALAMLVAGCFGSSHDELGDGGTGGDGRGDGGAGTGDAAGGTPRPRLLVEMYGNATSLVASGDSVYWTIYTRDFPTDIQRTVLATGTTTEIGEGPSVFTIVEAVSAQHVFFDSGGRSVSRVGIDGSNPGDQVYTPDSRWFVDDVYVWNDLLVTESHEGTVRYLVSMPHSSGATTVLTTLEGDDGDHPHRLADGDALYFIEQDGGMGHIKKLRAGSITTFATGEFPGKLTMDPEHIYWMDEGDLYRAPRGGGAKALVRPNLYSPYCVREDWIYYFEGSFEQTYLVRIPRFALGDPLSQRAADLDAIGSNGWSGFPTAIACTAAGIVLGVELYSNNTNTRDHALYMLDAAQL